MRLVVVVVLSFAVGLGGVMLATSREMLSPDLVKAEAGRGIRDLERYLAREAERR